MNMFIGLIIVLGVLIFFHELGHFIVAKAFGVGVEKFSLGFGPKIVSKKVGRTEYCISALPLGGFVKMVGEQPDSEFDPEDAPYAFNQKPAWKRILIVAAGPFFNFFLAVVIFFGVFGIVGLMVLQPVIGEVKPESPAEEAGLKKGDRIVSVAGKPVDSWSDMAEHIGGGSGEAMTFTIERGEKTLERTIAPARDSVENMFGEAEKRYVIGITASGKTRSVRLNPIEALGESLYRTGLIVKLTIVSIVKMIQGAISADNLGGPIMIAQMAGEQVRHGAVNLLSFIALVSVNLGILNLLPVPVLDGGHIVFFSIEAATGRPVSLKTREVAQQIGLFLLLMLMVFVFYNDIMRIVSN
ncbi:MAG: RIP metalloprotease RseP [Thermodesulfobacteriota bacterium]